MESINRRSFLQKSVLTGMGMTLLSSVELNAGSEVKKAPITIPTGKRSNKPFRFGLLTETEELGEKMYKGYDEAIIPVEIMMKPLENNSKWYPMRDKIKSWGFPMRSASHYPGPSGPFTGPDVDFELAEFYAKRAINRCAELGIVIVGVYGMFFPVPDGFSKTRATDQAIRFCHMLADLAEPKGMYIALEPRAGEKDLWPRYLDGVEFARRVGRSGIRCMADTNYFIQLNQDLNDIKKYPEYCIHADTQGDNHAQPGVGDREKIHTEYFRVLRDIGYENCVSFACPWINSSGGAEMDLALETKKSLDYMKRIRDKVYAE
jgi:sugar phosphate isomerase/epimerase